MRKMRWIGWVLLCCLLAGGVGASVVPFGWGDVEPVMNVPEETVGEFVRTYAPRTFAWDFLGEATGETSLSLHSDAGELVLTLYDVQEILLPDRGMSAATELPAEAMGEPAHVRGASWSSPDFPLPPIRGLGVGATRAEVLAAYPAQGDEVLYTGELINPAYDDSWVIGLDFLGGRVVPMTPDASGFDEAIEYSLATLDEPEQWREYYVLTYYIADGVVQEIRLAYDCDAE